jgi:drug/metabolite transporter (DMT)-like permease
MILRFRAELFLLLATMIWGGTFPVISVLLEYADAGYIVAWRFAIASIVLLPFLLRGGFFNRLRSGLRAGLLLGALNLSGFYLQTLGLVYTSPAKSAFITHLLVIYVLAYQAIWGSRSPGLWNYISIAIILLGAWVLVQPAASEINLGDWITLISAGAFAGYIIIVDRNHSRGDAAAILFTQFLLCSAGGFALAYLKGANDPIWTPTSILLLLYLAIPASLIALYIMLRFQPATTPVRASILYAMEPLFATLIALVYPGIWPAFHEWIGGAFILCGVILSEVSSLLNSGAVAKEEGVKRKEDQS